MQTFLPYPDFAESAKVLDRLRLGKQRVEAWQILRGLRGESNGWRNHPAVKMWAGYENALACYGVAVCKEWIRRGFRDTLLERFQERIGSPIVMPPWLGDPPFHAAHRSNLLRKDPIWYGQFGWSEPHDLPYIWPIAEEGANA